MLAIIPQGYPPLGAFALPVWCRFVQDDGLFLRKRSIVETIIDQLKNISQIEQSRHRSPQNFLRTGPVGAVLFKMVNLICGLIRIPINLVK